MSPASLEHTTAFQEFTAYLKQRQRVRVRGAILRVHKKQHLDADGASAQAGVAPLANGYLLLLTPIPNWDTHLRCLVIKSKTAEQDIESVSSHSSARSEEDGAMKNGTLVVTATSESEPNSPRKKRRRKHGQERERAAEATATEVLSH